MNLDTVTWILGTDLGLIAVATIFASAWVRVSRIDKLESTVEKLGEKFSRVEILETKINAIEDGIEEIKNILNREKR